MIHVEITREDATIRKTRNGRREISLARILVSCGSTSHPDWGGGEREACRDLQLGLVLYGRSWRGSVVFPRRIPEKNSSRRPRREGLDGPRHRRDDVRSPGRHTSVLARSLGLTQSPWDVMYALARVLLFPRARPLLLRRGPTSWLYTRGRAGVTCPPCERVK